MNKTYRIGEFAKRAGVTVRALHHYDHVGLLSPAQRSDSGYRLYADADLIRLQHIVTLKSLGFDLEKIRATLAAPEYELEGALKHHIELLESRKSQVEKALTALRHAYSQVRNGRKHQWATFVRIIEAMNTMNDFDFTSHFSAEQLAELKERALSPDEQAKISNEWATLFRDISDATAMDPRSPQAVALLARWDALVAGFTQRDPAMEASLQSFYANAENRAKTEHGFPGMKEAAQFIETVREALP